MVRLKSTIYLIAALYTILIYPESVYGLVVTNWAACKSIALDYFSANPQANFLRDWAGDQTNSLRDAIGVTYGWCVANCPGGYKRISWDTFSPQFSSWLLPWIALTSQLPFETRSRRKNFEALLLAIGSPFLIIYSLAITISNASTINTAFRRLKQDARSLERHEVGQLISAARVLMIETQSIPFRAVNDPQRELVQLIFISANWPWWTAVTRKIISTKRQWTQSLIFQLCVAVTAHVISIVNYFKTPADGITLSIGLAINSLWVWLVPVTLGWVKVGTQTSAGTIKTALESVIVPALSGNEITGKCVGFRDRSCYSAGYWRWAASPSSFGDYGANDLISDAQDSENDSASNTTPPPEPPVGGNAKLANVPLAQNDDQIEILKEHDYEEQPVHWRFGGWDFSAAGDNSEPGPIFNYARSDSHMTTVYLVEDALRNLVIRLRQDSSFDGNSRELVDLSKYISSSRRDFHTLPVHSHSLEATKSNRFKATITAIFLGWGTIGSGLLIAYKTPTIGLSCDSGAYLLYGCAAFTSFSLLTRSARLSHLISSHTETHPTSIFNSTPSIKFRLYIPFYPHGPSLHIPISISRLTTATILLRLTGKFLAIFNAFFLLLTNILQFTNMYDNCWCSAAVMSLAKAGGWVVLFASDKEIADKSRAAWEAGVFLSVGVVVVSLLGNFLLEWLERWKKNESISPGSQ